MYVKSLGFTDSLKLANVSGLKSTGISSSCCTNYPILRPEHTIVDLFKACVYLFLYRCEQAKSMG